MELIRRWLCGGEAVRYGEGMRVRLLAVATLLGSCGTTPLPQRLEDACEAHICPDDSPKYIDCMPVVAPAWEPICSQPCRNFLQGTCKIQFVD